MQRQLVVSSIEDNELNGSDNNSTKS